MAQGIKYSEVWIQNSAKAHPPDRAGVLAFTRAHVSPCLCEIVLQYCKKDRMTFQSLQRFCLRLWRPRPHPEAAPSLGLARLPALWQLLCCVPSGLQQRGLSARYRSLSSARRVDSRGSQVRSTVGRGAAGTSAVDLTPTSSGFSLAFSTGHVYSVSEVEGE